MDLGVALLARATSAVHTPVVIVAAVRDFEDWLYASAETLELGLEFDLGKRGKTQIVKAMRPKSYVKPVYQPKLAARMDLDVARGRSASLDRALRKFDELRRLVSP